MFKHSNYRKVITKLSTFVCHEYMNICLKGEFNKQNKKNRLHVHVFSFGIFVIYIVYTFCTILGHVSDISLFRYAKNLKIVKCMLSVCLTKLKIVTNNL